MSFFSNVGRALKKGVKAVGNAATAAAPIASLIPGIGASLSTGLGIVGNALTGNAAPFLNPPPAPPVYGPAQPSGGIGFGAIAAIAALYFLSR